MLVPMSTTYPAISVGPSDRARAPHTSHGPPPKATRIMGAADPNATPTQISAPSWGDRLLSETHSAKCLLLSLVRQFLQEYALQVSMNGPDLSIRTCNYVMRNTRRSTFESSSNLTLVPEIGWTMLNPSKLSAPDEDRVYWTLQPDNYKAVITLPHIPQKTTDFSTCIPPGMNDLDMNVLPLLDPLVFGVTILCDGAAVDRSMHPQNIREIPARAAAAHRAGKNAGVFFHGLIQEPLCEWQENSDGFCPTEYLSKTSDGVRTVIYNAGEGEREHPLTRHLVRTVALGLRDIHLSMDDLFSTTHPPRWPMVLAFMQLCKRSVTPQMSYKAMAVLEAYGYARQKQFDLEDRLLCAEFLSDHMYGAPAYSQMQESYLSADYSNSNVPATTHALRPYQALHEPHRRTTREPFGAANKPQCTIC